MKRWLEVTNSRTRRPLDSCVVVVMALVLTQVWAAEVTRAQTAARERISLNADWRFTKGDPHGDSTGLSYDVRPEVRDRRDDRSADARPREAVEVAAEQVVLKPWILPRGNDFIKDPSARHARPEGNPGGDVSYVQVDFDDSAWERVTLPHDWAIKGPFQQGRRARVGGGMGRLPSPGIGWYRKRLDIPASDAGKSIFLDVDGAMSYALVWLNGHWVGGWPYGYASWRVDLTPYVMPGGENTLSVRLDNPPNSARWYPGGGLYRNVWLVKTDPVHVSQWGTFVTTRDVSQSSATIDLAVTVDNDGKSDARVDISTEIYVLDADGRKTGEVVAKISPSTVTVKKGGNERVAGSTRVANPSLWRPPPNQTPHRYVAVTTLQREGNVVDQYVSAYELYTAPFGSSADKVFASLDRHPYVAGGFVWSGWDYLGEPTPYYGARSSYYGVIDLAGFKKDRFYLYQAHWRPDLPMAHILPHWTWPERVGQVTPVHVFTSGDEAELFLNGKSMGRKAKGQYQYRLRWDDVVYAPGELKVVTFKAGKPWAQAVMKTAGAAAKLLTEVDRGHIAADGRDLSFITVTIADKDGLPVPRAKHRIRFSIEGPGELVATGNGDPTSLESFQSSERAAFNGLCLAILRAKPGQPGTITLKAESEGLVDATVTVRSEKE